MPICQNRKHERLSKRKVLHVVLVCCTVTALDLVIDRKVLVFKARWLINVDTLRKFGFGYG